MKSALAYLKMLPTVFAVFFAVPALSQYKKTLPITASKFDFQLNPYRSLVSSKIKKIDNSIYLSWSVVNDTLEGHFAVYKSKDHLGPFIPLEFIKYPKGIAKNVSIYFSCSDKEFDNENNIYFVVKLNKNSLVLPMEERIYESSIVSFVIEDSSETTTPVIRKISNSELYTQEFDGTP
jgi:hypothetical protein